MSPPSFRPVRVLVVDNDPATVATSAAVLTTNGCIVRSSHNPGAALTIAAEFHPDVLVTDVAMPEMLGFELACKIVEAVPTCRIVFHTGEMALLTSCDFSVALPGFAVLEKPATAAELVAGVLGKATPRRHHLKMSLRMRRVEAPAGGKPRWHV